VIIVGHPNRRQFAGPVTARQFLRIPAVRLHPVAGLAGHQARRDHFAGDSQLRELPIQHIARGTSFIAGPEMLHRSQLVDQLANRFQTVGNHAQRAHLPFVSATATAIVSAWTSRPTKRTLDMSDQFLSYAALRRCFSLIHSVTHVNCESALVAPY